MRITKTIIACEDNMFVVMSSTEPGSIFQHKSVSSSYHFCREPFSEDIVQARHVRSRANLADGLTKGMDSTDFNNCFQPLMSN